MAIPPGVEESGHTVAVLALDRVIPFGLATPSDVFTQVRLPDGRRPYQVRVCGPGAQIPDRSRAGEGRVLTGPRDGLAAITHWIRTGLVQMVAERGIRLSRRHRGTALPGGSEPSAHRSPIRRAWVAVTRRLALHAPSRCGPTACG